jgi:hypothetical protein
MYIARDDIIARLRPDVRDQLTLIEHTTELKVRFARLPGTSHVDATYTFNPQENVPTVGLATKWEDVDVAHELIHMQLELVDGYKVLAWRRNVMITDALSVAMQALRGLTDDEVVHARLLGAGFELDGEVLKHQLFDDRCKTIPTRLRSASSLKNDGMAHLDCFGFGDLYRAILFVQVQLIRDGYSDMLSAERLTVLDNFLNAFSISRPRQYRKAKRILRMFQEHDVQTIDGHSEILVELTSLEKVNKHMGVSSYYKENRSYILPWPEN